MADFHKLFLAILLLLLVFAASPLAASAAVVSNNNVAIDQIQVTATLANGNAVNNWMTTNAANAINVAAGVELNANRTNPAAPNSYMAADGNNLVARTVTWNNATVAYNLTMTNFAATAWRTAAGTGKTSNHAINLAT